MKVLVVDDEPNILMSLDFLMRKEGYEVFVARNGREAIELLQKEIPALVVLDIMMPDVDGYEVCTLIKKRKELAHIKVIFLSAKSKPVDIEKGYEVGADLYLTKPFSTRNLVGKVKELLQMAS
ncbi:MAG: response regulator transcription factor [Thermonemataceae bacterium]